MKEVQESNGFKDEPADNQEECVPVLGEPDTQDESESLLTTPIRIIAHPHAKSSVWKHFGFMPLGDTNTPDRRRVLCRLCYRELPYCNNTTNLQYHLQRNHKDIVPVPGVREIRTSPVSRTARRAARVPERFRDSVEENHAPSRKRSLSTRVTACSLLTPTVTLEESEFVSAGSLSGSCGQWNWQNPAVAQPLATIITRSLMKDCLPLSTIEGSGFQDIIRLVDPSFEFQSASQLRSQVVPSLFVEEKKLIQGALRGNRFCALTLDSWVGRNSTSYLGVACHFINSQWNLDSRYLATLERASHHQLPSDLSQQLQRTLSEWRLQSDGEISGCTVEESDRCMVSALSHLRLPHVPCLASVLRGAARRAMRVPCVDTALAKLFRFSDVLQGSPELRAKLHERSAALNLPVADLYLPENAEWFQVYPVLLKLHNCREALNEVFGDALGLNSASAALTDDEFASLEDLEAVLRPLNEAADTLSNESYPPASLVLPLLFRLTRISLAETPDDSWLLREVKGHVRGALSDAYDGEETQQLLRMAMFLDPRLKRLPFYNQEEKNALLKLVQKELTKLVKEDCADSPPLSTAENGSPCKKSRLTTLLGDLFATTDDQDVKPRIAIRQPASMADNSTRQELQCYNSQEAISLEDTQPLHWWKVREEEYPNLSVLARKVLCIPATAVPMRRLLSEEGQSWNEKRSALASQDVADIVFLSHNLGQETATP